MASDVLGGAINLHYGGEDLRWPHHDNEVSFSLFSLRDYTNYENRLLSRLHTDPTMANRSPGSTTGFTPAISA